MARYKNLALLSAGISQGCTCSSRSCGASSQLNDKVTAEPVEENSMVRNRATQAWASP